MSTTFISTKERSYAGATVTTVNLDTDEVRVELTQGYHFQVGGRRRGLVCGCGCGATVQPDSKGLPRRFKRGHNMKPATRGPRDVTERVYSLYDCLGELCGELEERAGDWRVRTISTPTSILADIRGRKLSLGGSPPPDPDLQILSKIGYPHLHERGAR